MKDRHVMIFGELSELGATYARTLLAEGVKSLTIVNNDPDGFEDVSKALDSEKVTHLSADLSKISDLDEVYTKTLEINKKIDVVINSREVVADSGWEATVTTHINCMIRNTLLAMKHLGKMNGGKGGTVVNSLAMLDYRSGNHEDESSSDPLSGIGRLLNDLDRSFGNPYYYSSTGVQILTMCAHLETAGQGGSSADPPPGATRRPGNGLGEATATLLQVLQEKKSALAERRNGVEQFEIEVPE